jgi:DNA-binding transcriptional ArsR family regulator
VVRAARYAVVCPEPDSRPGQRQPDHLAFAALGDPVRRALIARLAHGDATVGELAEPFDLTPQAISHPVGVLRRCGLVEQRREGTRRPCRLRVDQLAQLGGWIDDQRRAWGDRLDTLGHHLTTGQTGAP